MSVQFIGMVVAQETSESIPPKGPALDKKYLRALVRAHDASGFDRILIAHSSASVDGLQIAADIIHQSDRIAVLLANRPGFISPTYAARAFATLDQFSDGRLAIHIISGGDDQEQQRDGDYLDHDQRYARSEEYIQILKEIWTNDRPIDHEGTYYKFKGAFSSIKPAQKPHIPIYFGGSSDVAIKVAGRFADVYALWGESLAQVRETIARVRAAAAPFGRANQIKFSLSLRPVLGATEAKAWEKADEILTKAKAAVAQNSFYQRTNPPANVGSLRLLETAANGRVVDKRLWTEIAALTGAKGNSTSLVGTPEQVAESLLEYYDLGITTFLIRGFDPLEDTIEYGRELIPLVREAVAEREAAAPSAEAKAG
ncbi:LLM class flavin-dependent oxidoreductase [Hyphomicrobium sp. 2TAF46]|uniref:LLM class flavin-dependent oxidoreductase n=1 Tax=Hyphomicrobium sp. 2TAF46 TaxID=3233019 RepID=UPI003F8F9A96